MKDVLKSANINGMIDDLSHLDITHSLIIVEINTYFSSPKDTYHKHFSEWNKYITSIAFLETIKNLISKGNFIVLDATMEARQSKEVQDKLKQLDVDATSVQELSAATGRPANVKFSK